MKHSCGRSITLPQSLSKLLGHDAVVHFVMMVTGARLRGIVIESPLNRWFQRLTFEDSILCCGWDSWGIFSLNKGQTLTTNFQKRRLHALSVFRQQNCGNLRLSWEAKSELVEFIVMDSQLGRRASCRCHWFPRGSPTHIDNRETSDTNWQPLW